MEKTWEGNHASTLSSHTVVTPDENTDLAAQVPKPYGGESKRAYSNRSCGESPG